MSFHLPPPESRRNFLRKALSIAVGTSLAAMLVAMLRRERASKTSAPVSIPPDVAPGLTLIEGAVVYREGEAAIRAFEARCTHLGCRIDRVAGDEIICPCHGSRFRADGTVVTGPATKPLVALRIEPDPKTGGWTARATG
jgi:nitrite reductase/ring-hydroxylating ferredoxin subunit